MELKIDFDFDCTDINCVFPYTIENFRQIRENSDKIHIFEFGKSIV